MQAELGTIGSTGLKRPISVSCLAMVSIPLSMDFGIFHSTVFALFLTINSFFGAYTYIQISHKKVFHFAELFGFGIAIGTALPALINFLVRLMGITLNVTGAIFPVICCLIIFVKRSRSNTPRIKIQLISGVDLCLILAAPIFAVVAWSDRMWPFCAVLAVAIGWISKSERRAKELKTTKYLPWVMFIAGAFINTTINKLLKHGLIWKSHLGVDIAFDEAQSWSVSHFGLSENVFLSGHPTKGHILTHAWAGDFASFTNAPKFITTAMTGYGVGILGLSALLCYLTYEMNGRKIAARVSILLFLVQASIPEQFVALPSPRMANSLSMLWLVAFWFLYTANWQKRNLYSLPILAVAMFIVTLAKFQWGITAALTISLVPVTRMFLRKGEIADFLLPALITIILPITYFLFLNGMDAREDVVLKIQIGLLPILITMLLTRTSLSKFPRIENEQMRLIRNFYLVSTIFSVLLIWITNAGNQATYFLYPVLWLSASYLGLRIERIFFEKQIQLSRILLIAFSGFSSGTFIGISYYYLYNRLTNNSNYQLLKWIYVGHPEILQPLALLSVFAGLLTLMIFIRRGPTHSNRALLSVVIPTLIIFNVSANFANWITTSNASTITKIWFDVNRSPDYALNKDQFKIAQWIDNHVGTSEIGASNFLCFTEIEPGGRTPSLDISSECKNRNMLPWISALTHRRMIIDAPLTSLMGAGAVLEEKFRINYNAVLSFGSRADLKSFKILENRGVSWFIVDREQSNLNSWQPYAEIVFTTDRYFVLELLPSTKVSKKLN
jgi:hypothetical protein